MTFAYDAILLERAADTLGRMLDYSVYSLHYDIAGMMDVFIASGAAEAFERGDIRIIAGMSGIELAFEVLDRSGISFQRMQPRYTKGLSAEYWCGQALARAQWGSGLPFHHFMRSFSPSSFCSDYGKSRLAFLESLPPDTDAKERASGIASFGSDFAQKAASDLIASYAGGDIAAAGGDTPLKRMRIKNGLSQSGLASASGVPLRTIQQYEQRQKDLSKARAEYLIALSRALNCEPVQLLPL